MLDDYNEADKAFFKRVYRAANFNMDSFRIYPKETTELRRIRYESEVWSIRYSRRYGMQISFDTTVTAGIYSASLTLDEDSELRRDILRDIRARNFPVSPQEAEKPLQVQIGVKI